MENIENFKIIGISVETTNKNGKAAEDLGILWQRFFSENVIEKITDKVDANIYAIYTNYESDFNGKYETIIGVKVNSLENIPSGLVGKKFETESFTHFVAKGEMPNSIANKWGEIWANDKNLNRKYTYDFELYSEKSQQGANCEVDIFIATQQN